MPRRPTIATSPRPWRMASISLTLRSPVHPCECQPQTESVLELAREERPAPVELAEHVPLERRVPLQELSASTLPGAASSPRACIRARTIGRSSIGQMNAAHSNSFRLPEKPVELVRVVRNPEPAPEHEVLRRRDGRDRVELQPSERPDGPEHVGSEAVEQLRTHGDAARLLDRDHAVRHAAS